MAMVELHEEGSEHPVFVNPVFVTFVQKSSTSPGSIVGLIGDDLGCVVRESVAEVGRIVNAANAGIELVSMPHDAMAEDIVKAYEKAHPGCAVQSESPKERPATEETEVRKPRKVRKWHSRKPFDKESKSENDND